MAGRGKRDRGKELFWRRMFRLWRRRGLSVRAFCAEHGVAEASFYEWRRVIAQRDQEAAAVRAEPGSADRTGPVSDHAPVFVPLRVLDALAPVALEVMVQGGHVVRIVPGFDAETLRQLLAVLEEKRPC
jgi:transposase-like protein